MTRKTGLSMKSSLSLTLAIAVDSIKTLLTCSIARHVTTSRRTSFPWSWTWRIFRLGRAGPGVSDRPLITAGVCDGRALVAAPCFGLYNPDNM